jgi:ribosomal protein S6--L-glutamate ligase
MRIAFLLEPTGLNSRRHDIARVTRETIQELRGRGVHVDVFFGPDSATVVDLCNIRPEHDLYVLKSKCSLTHSLAGAIEAAGGLVVNTYASSMLTWDKVAATGVLAAAGISVPSSWTAGNLPMFERVIDEGPLWLKPQHGKSGSGVRRVHELPRAEDEQAPGLDAFGFPIPVFAQREVPTDGVDFKVYAVGDRMWSMLKRWPARRPEDKIGVAVPLPEHIQRVAHAVGRALGLELYGVDFLLPDNDPARCVVVDVNAFPGYNGLADAPEALAAFLFERARNSELVGAAA